jgi:hypothetical protein
MLCTFHISSARYSVDVRQEEDRACQVTRSLERRSEYAQWIFFWSWNMRPWLVRFQVLATANMEMTAFRDTMPCRLHGATSQKSHLHKVILVCFLGYLYVCVGLLLECSLLCRHGLLFYKPTEWMNGQSFMQTCTYYDKPSGNNISQLS